MTGDLDIDQEPDDMNDLLPELLSTVLRLVPKHSWKEFSEVCKRFRGTARREVLELSTSRDYVMDFMFSCNTLGMSFVGHISLDMLFIVLRRAVDLRADNVISHAYKISAADADERRRMTVRRVMNKISTYMLGEGHPVPDAVVMTMNRNEAMAACAKAGRTPPFVLKREETQTLETIRLAVGGPQFLSSRLDIGVLLAAPDPRCYALILAHTAMNHGATRDHLSFLETSTLLELNNFSLTMNMLKQRYDKGYLARYFTRYGPKFSSRFATDGITKVVTILYRTFTVLCGDPGRMTVEDDGMSISTGDVFATIMVETPVHASGVFAPGISRCSSGAVKYTVVYDNYRHHVYGEEGLLEELAMSFTGANPEIYRILTELYLDLEFGKKTWAGGPSYNFDMGEIYTRHNLVESKDKLAAVLEKIYWEGFGPETYTSDN